MQDFRADLHCHTTCSDGTFTPTELVRLAKNIGLSALSITDHDTINSYAEAAPLCAELGIELLSGIELSTSIFDHSVHILGYGFQLDSPFIRDFCIQHIERRNQRNQAIFDLLAKNGMPVKLEDLSFCGDIIGRPHIATAMVNKGYVGSVQAAFKKYLSEGCSCYTAGNVFSVEETLNVIHKAKGLAIIAHPHLIKRQKVIKELLQMNFDGIECYYGRFLSNQHQRWIKIAKQKKWLITGGSDFHGTVKPMSQLGSSWVDRDTFQAIKNRL